MSKMNENEHFSKVALNLNVEYVPFYILWISRSLRHSRWIRNLYTLGTNRGHRFSDVYMVLAVQLWIHSMDMIEYWVLGPIRAPNSAPGPQNEQNEREWTFFKSCPDRFQTTWDRFVSLLGVTLRSFESLGRPERQLEGVYIWGLRVSRF